MKNKYFFIILCLLLHAINSALADEIIFESKDINILDNGNRIISNQGVAQSLDHGLTIKADNFDYNKNASILVATKDAMSFLPKEL